MLYEVITTTVAGGVTVETTHDEMFNNFCSGNDVKVASVRVYNPVSMRELDCTTDACEMVPATANVVSNCDNATNRITSYNVCYTKLLRTSAVPSSTSCVAI